MSTGFQVRAPWYVRERGNFDLTDPRARRPVIQMYDSTDFVDRLTADPADSLAFGLDDRWSYPVAAAPSGEGKTRFATSKLVHSTLRKLYQPAHSRFYAVVVEVFCDSPGLPRAGSHNDIDVSFVMRRQHTSVAGDRRSVRKLARGLMAEMAKDQHNLASVKAPDLDVDELWWAKEAERIRFEEDNAALIDNVDAHTEEQAWMVGSAGGQWRKVGTSPATGRPPDEEERLPMWRLPPRAEDCDAARTRSLWFGLVPTYAADHWTDEKNEIQPKLDNRAIFQLRCIVTKRPERGREHCPPQTDVSAPTRPFRLAAAFDPDGSKNRTISVTAPDLRRLAARATQRQGPGGFRISTPPNSGLSPIDFDDMTKAGAGTTNGGAICTFAFELFFIVAFFLFLLFLPIVVFVFQLWWMLALRFCIPPSASFGLLADFFAAGGLLATIESTDPDLPHSPAQRVEALIGILGRPDALTVVKPDNTKWIEEFDKDSDPSNPGRPLIADLVAAQDPKDAQLTSGPPDHLETPPDPLCPKP